MAAIHGAAGEHRFGLRVTLVTQRLQKLPLGVPARRDGDLETENRAQVTAGRDLDRPRLERRSHWEVAQSVSFRGTGRAKVAHTSLLVNTIRYKELYTHVMSKRPFSVPEITGRGVTG